MLGKVVDYAAPILNPGMRLKRVGPHAVAILTSDPLPSEQIVEHE
jgi:hypothetical protein